MDSELFARLTSVAVVVEPDETCVRLSAGARAFFGVGPAAPNESHTISSLAGPMADGWRLELKRGTAAATLEHDEQCWRLTIQPVDATARRLCEFVDLSPQLHLARAATAREAMVFSQLRSLLQLSRGLHALSFPDLAQQAANLSQLTLTSPRVDVWLFEDDAELFSEQGLRLRLQSTAGTGRRAGVRSIEAAEVPILHMVRAHQQLERDDVAHDPLSASSSAFFEPQTTGALFAGLFVQAEMVGVLVCQRDDGQSWSPEARTFLGSVAVTLSLGLEAARRRNAETRLQSYVNDLESARARAESADRAKSEFLAVMSHEIRTPLNGVLGFAQLLSGTTLDEEQRSFVSTLKVSGEHLMVIINDILDFSKIEEGKLVLAREPFDLETVVSEALELMAAGAASKRLELTLEYDRQVPRHLLGDAGRTRQAILNLVSNAVKFTERGSVIVRVVADAVGIRLSVTDNGIGISPADQERLFTRFTQVESSSSRRFGGTGLGLAISKRLVDLMGGAFTLVSAPGHGSTFSFTLPAQAVTLADVSEPEELIVGLIGASEAQRAMWASALGPSARRVESWSAFGLEQATKESDVVVLSDEFAPRTESGPAALIWRCGQAGAVPGPWSIPSHFVRPETIRDVVHRARQRQRVKTPVPEPTGLPGFTGARVLVVDDNPINLRLAERMLSKQGCTVTRASDGHEALELVRNAAFELVLMDCNMPVMDGLEATRQIRALERAEGRPMLAIVALTADAMQSERDECVRAGMNDHVSKPVREERLREVLGHFISRPTLAAG